jgi:hypothetical protein
MFTTIKFTGKCDAWVSIDTIKASKENESIYGDLKEDREYIEELKKDILELGLNTPISVWKKGKNYQTKGGHNRMIALTELGETQIPIIIMESTPSSTTEKMEQMLSDNMRKRQTSVEKYKSIKTIRDQRTKDVGYCQDKDIKRYCIKVQTTWKTYEMLRELDEKRPDLFQRVANDENALSVSAATNLMKEDAKRNSKQLSAAKALDDLIKEEHIKKTIFSFQDFMHRFYELDMNINGNRHSLVPTYQENILSGVAHETFANIIAKILTEDKNVKVDAPNNQKPYDLVMHGYCWEPEVKFAKWTGKNILNIHWQGRYAKSGYYFLIAVDHTVERFFVAYGFIKDTMWERAGQLVSLSLENVYKSNLKTFLGEIKEVKGEYQIHLDKPSI